MDSEKIASQIAGIDTQLEQKKEQLAKLRAKKQAILNRSRSAEEKARTRTLIQIGAILGKYFGISSVEEAEAYVKKATVAAPAEPPPIPIVEFATVPVDGPDAQEDGEKK